MPPPRGLRLVRAAPGFAAVAVAAAVLVVFGSAAAGEFLAWDDDINITANDRLRALTWDNVRWMFTDLAYMRRYVPLSWLNWAVEFQLTGLTARSAHVGNLLFHAANAALVFVLLRKIVAFSGSRNGSVAPAAGIDVAAALGAAFWALHPLRVEPVAWASGRMYGLATFLLLLSAIAYLNSIALPPGSGPRRNWHVLAALAFTASLLTYPIGLLYAGVLMVFDWYVRSRQRRDDAARTQDAGLRPTGAEKLPFVLVTLAVLGLTVWARFQAKGTWTPMAGLDAFPVEARAAQALYIWAYYAWRPLLPFGLTPVDPTLIEFDPWDWPFVLSGVAVVAVTALLIVRRARWPGVLALWSCHLLLLIPLLGLTEHPHYASDRYSHVASILWSVALGWILVRAWPVVRRRATALAFTAMALVGCAVMSRQQITLWRNSEALFRHVLARLPSAPHTAYIWFRFADVLRMKGNFPAARYAYTAGFRLADGEGPKLAPYCVGLGLTLEAEGKPHEAAAQFERAIRLDPDLAAAHYSAGTLLLEMGRWDGAARALTRAAGLNPTDATMQFQRGIACWRAGRRDEALAALEVAERLTRPSAKNGAGERTNHFAADVHHHLALVHREAGRPGPARRHLETALQLNPNHEAARALLSSEF